MGRLGRKLLDLQNIYKRFMPIYEHSRPGGIPGRVLGGTGECLEASCGCLGASWGILGACCAFWGGSSRILGASWSRFVGDVGRSFSPLPPPPPPRRRQTRLWHIPGHKYCKTFSLLLPRRRNGQHNTARVTPAVQARWRTSGDRAMSEYGIFARMQWMSE